MCLAYKFCAPRPAASVQVSYLGPFIRTPLATGVLVRLRCCQRCCLDLFRGNAGIGPRLASPDVPPRFLVQLARRPPPPSNNDCCYLR